MASTYLTRSLSSTSTSWTISLWVKRSLISSNQYIISWGSSGSTSNGIGFSGADLFQYFSEATSSNPASSAVYRDTNGWYHLVVKNNAGTITLYVNGEAITTTGGTSGSALSSSTFTIGRWTTGAYSFNGSMSHVHLTDGTAYDATAFGQYDANGVWTIKTSPSVTYGTEGFFILKDGNSVTDQSGEGNDFTVAGGTLTNTEDSPSNVFATMNPLFAGDANITYSNGNLKLTSTSEAQKNAVSTMAVSSGKWYCEMVSRTGTNYPGFGIMDSQSILQTSVSYLGSSIDSYCMFQQGDYYNNGSASSTGITWGVGSIMGIAIDLDSATKTIKFYKDGAEVHSATIATPANGYVFAASHNTNGTISEINFGNGYFGTTAVTDAGINASGIGIFEYDVPTGYTALSTKGLNL